MKPDPFANMELVDLSLPIFHDAPIWSAEPRCIVHDWIVQGRKHGQLEPINMKYFCMSGHQGTHCDAPIHLKAGMLHLDEIPLERFMGWARVLDFTEKQLGDHISAGDLESRGVKDCERILICTGWDRYFDPWDPTYFDMDHPHFSAEAIDWVLQHKLELVGMDVPSTDPYLADHPEIFRERDNFPIVIELMTNLDKIVGREVYLMALPLNVRDGDGSWMRAVEMVPSE